MIKRHSLQINLSGTCDNCVEKSLAAEENVLKALDHLRAVANLRLEERDVSGVDDELLARLQVDLLDRAVELEEHEPLAAQPLQHEALAAEEAALHAVHDGGERHARRRAEERALLRNVFLSRSNPERTDLARQGGGEGDVGLPLRGVGRHEQTLAREQAAEALAESALEIRIHRNAVRHPGHAAGLRINALAGVQSYGHRRHLSAENFVLHGHYSFI